MLSFVFLPACEAKRIALVIGNSTYKLGPLANPANDAESVAHAFRSIGFDHVQLRKNLGVREMRETLSAFGKDAHSSEIAVVFYAGHGTELNGKNYLIPTDATLDRAADLDFEAISLDAVIGQLDGAKQLRLIVLDACRNNIFPLSDSRRSRSRGLARIEPGDNTLVAYAAKEGTTADDGRGANSPFTMAFLKYLPSPGLEVRQLFGGVRDEVMAETDRQQQPHVYGTLGFAPIYLSNITASSEVSPSRPKQSLSDLLNAIQGMTDRQRIDVLTQHPAPEVRDAARARLELLFPRSAEGAPNAPIPSQVPISPAVIKQVGEVRFFFWRSASAYPSIFRGRIFSRATREIGYRSGAGGLVAFRNHS